MKTLLISLIQLAALGAGTAWAAPQTVSIDRFSDQSAHLFRRSGNSMLPGPNQPIAFDQGPFITKGLAPDGSFVSYYNFDVQPTHPAPIYVLIREGDSTPVMGQMNIVDVIPGDQGYNDFWNPVMVTVPKSYQANQAKSLTDLVNAGYKMMPTSALVNCPIVPAGSTAKVRYAGGTDTGLHLGWYKGNVINYFNFSERALTLTMEGTVPLSPIYVTFNKNPSMDDPSSGPASGFVTDMNGRVHNVVATIPENMRYSPLWLVNIYNNRDFAMVHDLDSARTSNILVRGAATVNCPVVEHTPAM